jgi:superoxide dismutase, Cu-Zn family
MKPPASLAMLAVAVLAGCATPVAPTGRAEIRPASGSKVAGVALFAQTDDGVRIFARVSGLAPGEHGFHIHEVGDCSAPDAMSAKGHFNPTNMPHGHVMAGHHAGDIPNLRAEANGIAEYTEHVEGMILTGHPHGIAGRAVVVHADADDYISQPAGNSGKRVGCGVIVLEAAK